MTQLKLRMTTSAISQHEERKRNKLARKKLKMPTRKKEGVRRWDRSPGEWPEITHNSTRVPTQDNTDNATSVDERKKEAT